MVHSFLVGAVSLPGLFSNPGNNPVFGRSSRSCASSFGYQRAITTRLEEVPEEEMHRRGQAWLVEMAEGKRWQRANSGLSFFPIFAWQ